MRALALLLVVLFATPLHGQDIRFTRIMERDGLVHHDVRAICPDDLGAIWLATGGGLSRFDGTRFEHFGRGQGLPAQATLDLSRDEHGMLWVATPGGLARMDPFTNEVAAWGVGEERASIISNRVIRVIPLAGDQVLCVTEDGFWAFDVSNGSWRRLLLPDGTVLSKNAHLSVADSSATGCWLSTSEHGLVYYRSADGRILHADDNPDAHPLLTGIHARSMCKGIDGSWWLAGPGDNELTHYRPSTGRLQRWSHVPGRPDRRFDQAVTQLACDRKGRLWVSTISSAFLLDLNDSAFVKLRHDPADPGTLSHGAFGAWHESESGLIWLGTRSGLSIHDPEGFQYRTIDPGTHFGLFYDLQITGLALQGEQVLWMATTEGLIRYDEAAGHYERYTVATGGANSVLDLMMYGEELWLATRDGLWRFHTRTQKASRLDILPKDGVDRSGRVFAWIRRDALGRIWTYGRTQGLFRFDPATDERVTFPSTRNKDSDEGIHHFPEPALGISDANPRRHGVGLIHGMLATADGQAWFAHDIDGLVRFNPITGAFTSPRSRIASGELGGGTVSAMTEGPRNEIWFFVHASGLFKYEPDKDRYTKYTPPEGTVDESAWGLIADGQGRIWIGTRNGLACFDPRTERFHLVPFDYGLMYNAPSAPVLTTPSGAILMTNLYSVLRFNPGAFAEPRPPLSPRVSRLLVDGRPRRLQGDSSLALVHGEHSLSLTFGVMGPPGSIRRHAYRLDGADWDIGEEGRVSIQGIAPGQHVIEMRVMGRDGSWSSISRLIVSMEPPWWQRIWARILLASMLAAGIVLLFRFRLNLIRRRERRAEAAARTVNELKLQALRAQMDPHFIFNCLNSIDKYILMEQGEQASRYLNRFARLVRLILNQSDSVSVPLEKEAEMLRYYLELEALRFKVPFAWDVKVDPELALAEAELPTMLVQPYVENAIWHGLQHKESAGRITVEFRKLGNELECTIEDDGIGREASALINAERRRAHQSKGMRVNADRLRLFEETHGSGVRSEIIDLKDRDGNALGTRVRLVLPIDSLEEEPQSA